jgi:hypothetical protein
MLALLRPVALDFLDDQHALGLGQARALQRFLDIRQQQAVQADAA